MSALIRAVARALIGFGAGGYSVPSAPPVSGNALLETTSGLSLLETTTGAELVES